MKLIYTTKKFIFESPEQMQDKMIEYLQYVDSLNADSTVKFCKNCGTILSKPNQICCDEPNLEYKLIQKQMQDHMRPTMYGFIAFCGIAVGTLHAYKSREGFPEVIEWFKTVLQMDLEQLLLNPFNRNVGGAKFVAINNFGWKDKQYIEQTNVQGVTFVNDIGIDNDDMLMIEEEDNGKDSAED